MQHEFKLELPPRDPRVAERKFNQLRHPIWTENKARLIQRYLYYFVQVTKHGTYIDGFAGPQEPEKPKTWAAKLVVESRPRWLRHFYFFEKDEAKVRMLQNLWENQPPRSSNESRRTMRVYPGDFNKHIGKMLVEHPIRPNEASFCLLDQRTFECDWASVSTIAAHKKSGNKVELFYFLGTSWMDRSISRMKDKDRRLAQWWGDSSWESFFRLRGIDRAKHACDRFRKELGYAFAYPFPIFGRQEGGRTMYYMIHASDHPQATPLMCRAYERALGASEPLEQLDWLKQVQWACPVKDK